MHAVFIPYGKRAEVELLLRDMEAQKHLIRMHKGNEEQFTYIQGHIRLLPFGVYEYVFPKESMDLVLHTLEFDSDRYNLGKLKLGFIRKMINCKPAPEYKKEKKYLWIRDNVMVIPVGIREDVEFTETNGIYEGWTHEAL